MKPPAVRPRLGFEERTIERPERERDRERPDLQAAASKLQMLENQVAALERELLAATTAITRLARGEPVDEIPRARVDRYQLWLCTQCGSRLGHYDKESDVLAVHYRDAFWWTHVGSGGWFKTICRSCCAENRLDNVEE